MTKAIIGRSGRFTVYQDGSFTGPKEYIDQVNVDKIMKSATILVSAAPTNIPVVQIVATALQTDYASWLGYREMKNWMKK